MLHHRWRECRVGRCGLQGLEATDGGRVNMLQEAVSRVSSQAVITWRVWGGTMPTATISHTVPVKTSEWFWSMRYEWQCVGMGLGFLW